MLQHSKTGLLLANEDQVLHLLSAAMTDERNFRQLLQYHPDLWSWLAELDESCWPAGLAEGSELRGLLQECQKQWDEEMQLMSSSGTSASDSAASTRTSSTAQDSDLDQASPDDQAQPVEDSDLDDSEQLAMDVRLPATSSTTTASLHHNRGKSVQNALLTVPRRQTHCGASGLNAVAEMLSPRRKMGFAELTTPIARKQLLATRSMSGIAVRPEDAGCCPSTNGSQEHVLQRAASLTSPTCNSSSSSWIAVAHAGMQRSVNASPTLLSPTHAGLLLQDPGAAARDLMLAMPRQRTCCSVLELDHITVMTPTRRAHLLTTRSLHGNATMPEQPISFHLSNSGNQDGVLQPATSCHSTPCTSNSSCSSDAADLEAADAADTADVGKVSATGITTMDTTVLRESGQPTLLTSNKKKSLGSALRQCFAKKGSLDGESFMSSDTELLMPLLIKKDGYDSSFIAAPVAAKPSKAAGKKGVLGKLFGKRADSSSRDKPAFEAQPKPAVKRGLCSRVKDEAERVGLGVTDMWTQVGHFLRQAPGEVKAMFVCGALPHA